MKYLIVGLGNIGDKYKNTRHNIGFMILDAMAKASNIFFEDKRLAYKTELKFKGKTLILIKPTTFMNLSGKSVRYWLKKENVPDDKLLIICDDIAFQTGHLKLKPKGGDAGHNGLRNIAEILGHQNFARLRFGIGNDFYSGQQSEYVLSEWTDEEKKLVDDKILPAIEIIKSFISIGLERTMSLYNNK
ncbi:MAG: aminoacyl-tRNA hydrolase [Bacteroidota bacterium]